uniref:Uncharacterized shell protein 13 n=1 Tax=Lottia gigantea TaxID=225164 RepID=USP13_LOTGI|nr:RecName: Full=Uncharacterized shell protein 13; Short=LUSP-13; Flags: Precursor [Lottia gigantea]
MMWNYFVTCIVLYANIISIHTFGLTGGNNLNQALGLTGGNPLDSTLGLSAGNAFPSGMGAMQIPAYLRMAPSVETICSTQSPLLNPRERNGLLSDLVGKEISRRSRFLAANPSLAGTGKWACAANYYSNVMRYRPNELGNVFGDLIDSTGCDGFTCDMVRGVRKTSPMSNFLNAMMISQMMQQPNAAQVPTTSQQQPTSNTGGQQPPTNASNPPTNPQPTPTPAQPTPSGTQVQQTPAANNGLDLTSMFNNPAFQEQLMRLVST